MEALYLLIPLSVLLVFLAIWLFFRMADGGQFDDMVGPAWRILQDDDSADRSDTIPREEAAPPPTSMPHATSLPVRRTP